jgi:hypothetical protein
VPYLIDRSAAAGPLLSVSRATLLPRPPPSIRGRLSPFPHAQELTQILRRPPHRPPSPEQLGAPASSTFLGAASPRRVPVPVTLPGSRSVSPGTPRCDPSYRKVVACSPPTTPPGRSQHALRAGSAPSRCAGTARLLGRPGRDGPLCCQAAATVGPGRVGRVRCTG